MKVNVFEFLKDAAGKLEAEAKNGLLFLYGEIEGAVLNFASRVAEKEKVVSARVKAALVELDAAVKEDKAKIVAEAAGLTVRAADDTAKAAESVAASAGAAEQAADKVAEPDPPAVSPAGGAPAGS
jgi:hypothetical protein